MPVIKRFGTVKVSMFFRDENPPHVHIDDGGVLGRIRIADCMVDAGKVSSRTLRTVSAWIEEDRNRLMILWTRMKTE